MSETKPVLTIVIASMRDSRKGDVVGRWIASEAEKHGGFTIQVADLKEINLPLMTEPNPPRARQYTQEKTWEWSRLIDGSDAFVFVMPEYNSSVSAPLANAIDYLVLEWQYKPAAIVSYGGLSGGMRAAQQLKERMVHLSMVPVAQQVALPFLSEHIKDGEFQGYELAEIAMRDALNALQTWHPALQSLRPLPVVR